MNKENVKSFYHLCPLNNLWQLLEKKQKKTNAFHFKLAVALTCLMSIAICSDFSYGQMLSLLPMFW